MTALTGDPPRIAMQTQAICHKIKERPRYNRTQARTLGKGLPMNYWQTDLIHLRGVEPEDGDIFWHWNQDSEIARNLDERYYGMTVEEWQQHYGDTNP